MMALILEAFSIFPKVYLGTWVANVAGRQSLAAGSSPLVMIRDIIWIKINKLKLLKNIYILFLPSNYSPNPNFAYYPNPCMKWGISDIN